MEAVETGFVRRSWIASASAATAATAAEIGSHLGRCARLSSGLCGVEGRAASAATATAASASLIVGRAGEAANTWPFSSRISMVTFSAGFDEIVIDARLAYVALGLAGNGTNARSQ